MVIQGRQEITQDRSDSVPLFISREMRQKRAGLLGSPTEADIFAWIPLPIVSSRKPNAFQENRGLFNWHLSLRESR